MRLGCPEEGDEHGEDGLHGVKTVESICVRISLTAISEIWSPEDHDLLGGATERAPYIGRHDSFQ